MSSIELIKWYPLHEGRVEEMRKTVGNAFWDYQHKLAEWTIPDDEHQIAAFQNLKSGVKTFPCKECADKGSAYLNANPYNSNVETFKQYVWKFHNKVNEKLEKPIFNYDNLKIYEPSDIEALNNLADSVDDRILREAIVTQV